jgi:hypothetical protein
MTLTYKAELEKSIYCPTERYSSMESERVTELANSISSLSYDGIVAFDNSVL